MQQAVASDDTRPLWWYARFLRDLCPDGGRVFHYGCGEGELLKQLTPYFEVYGYDESALVRHRARTNVPDAVVLEDWEDLPGEGFDIVVWLGALVRNRALPLMRQLKQPLAIGGWLIVIAPNPGGLAHRLKRRRNGLSLPTQGEWLMILRRAGLEVVRVQGDGLWDAPYLPLIPNDWQRAMFGAPLALSSYLPLSRWLLPVTLGESLILAARRKS